MFSYDLQNAFKKVVTLSDREKWWLQTDLGKLSAASKNLVIPRNKQNALYIKSSLPPPSH